MESFEISLQIKEQIEKNKFQIEDFDGKLINARTYFEERTYKLGTGLFKWVSWFKRDNVVKNLEIQFDSELGPDKNSWKGGIVATAIEYYHLEDQISAFRRFCNIEHYARNGKFRVKFLQEIKD